MSEQESSIGRWVSVLYRYRQNFLSKALEPYNLKSGQQMFLLALARHDGISQEELSDRLMIDKATTAKAIKKLEAAGYVTRGVDSADKRAYQVYLTAKARETLPMIRAAVREWDRLITAGLSESEGIMVEQLLWKLAHNACQVKNGVRNSN